MPALETIQEAEQMFITGLQAELEAQGHNATKKLSGSAVADSYAIEGGYQTDIYMLDYAKWVNNGRKPRPGFSGFAKRGTGTGQSSPVIEALTAWAQLKGFANPEKAAFAIYYNILKYGIPTPNSLQFSSTGKRIQFIDDVLTRLTNIVASMIAKEAFTNVSSKIDSLVDAYNNDRE